MIIGFAEVAILLALVSVLFGAGKLPQVMGSIGQAYREFKEGERNPDDEPPETKG